eukprot:COSAG01_NODE_5153_length_4449_cov_8.565287_4_plen_215_part_00
MPPDILISVHASRSDTADGRSCCCQPAVVGSPVWLWRGVGAGGARATSLAVVAELRASEALAVLRTHARQRPLTLTFCSVPSGRGKLVQRQAVAGGGEGEGGGGGSSGGGGNRDSVSCASAPAPTPSTLPAPAGHATARPDGSQRVAYEDFQNARKGLLDIVGSKPKVATTEAVALGSRSGSDNASGPKQAAAVGVVEPAAAPLEVDPYAAYRT